MLALIRTSFPKRAAVLALALAAAASPVLGQSAPPAAPAVAPQEGAPPAAPAPVVAPAPAPAPRPAVAPVRAGRQRALESETDPARRALLQGRFFIDDAEWAKAIAQLDDFMKKYPKDRAADQALYYYAFALKKLSKYDDSWRALERFAAEFPKSRWLRDAKALQIEIAPILGMTAFIDQEARQEGEDELKCTVLQSLAMSNQERARSAVRDILKPGSTARPQVKKCALIVLGQVGGPESRDILLGIVRDGSNAEMQMRAIQALGMAMEGDRFDDATFAALRELATSSQNADLARAAVLSLSHTNDPRVCQFMTEMATSASISGDVRRHAILMLGHQERCATFEALERIYTSNTDDETRRFVLMAIAERDDPRSLDLLVRVARSEQSVEMRRFAMLYLADKDAGRAVQVLVETYDSERNETIKEQIIVSLGQINDRRALEKLLRIAREDPSIEMRKKAIFWIGQSDDPEAARFLEEILK